MKPSSLLLAILAVASCSAATAARAVPLATNTLAADNSLTLQTTLSSSRLSSSWRDDDDDDDAPAPGPKTHTLPYSNPNTGACMANEQKVAIQGLPGSFCSPRCSPASPCPADTHVGATAQGECVLEPAGASEPSQCALICKPASPFHVAGPTCPKGATCQPIQGVGICTYGE
jgi:hypothetical protein